ncbi:MAG: hypothetical protein ACE3L7_32555 [Candidatus Pristimantibacillus sp.]
MDHTIHYGTVKGKEVTVSHNKRFIHTSIMLESQEQRDQALLKQVSQDIDRLASGQPSVTILVTESNSQLNLLRELTSKHKVPVYIVDGPKVTDPHDPALIEIYNSGGVILVQFNVPKFAKEQFYEQFFKETKDFIFNRGVEELIPTFIIVDQSIEYLFKEKKKKDDDKNKHEPNGIEFFLVVGRSRFIGVTLLLNSDMVVPPMIGNNTFNVFRFGKEHQWSN